MEGRYFCLRFVKRFWRSMRRKVLSETTQISDAHYNCMSVDNIKSRLRELGQLKVDGLREELLKVLKLHECKRHLMIWSDHSSIMNHGHLVLTVNAIYDPAFYYTSEVLHGKNVQELVEKPHIYIMARCRYTTIRSAFIQ